MEHKTKDGQCIEISDMSDGHLINTCRLIMRKATEGICIREGCVSDGDFYYDEVTLYDGDALKEMGYEYYAAELEKRGLTANLAKGE